MTANTKSPPSREQSFSVVFAVELWERFGYYGMQAILAVYLVQNLGMSDRAALAIMGAFFALTYITPVFGGYLGDRIIGPRRSMIMGASILAAGYLVLAIADTHRALLSLAMASIAAGNGLFKPNAANLVRRIYQGDDKRLDGVFTLYYMAVNVGSTLSMLFTPWLRDYWGQKSAFLTCFAGLVIGIIGYLWRRRWLESAGSARDQQALPATTLLGVVSGFVILIVVLSIVIFSPGLARICVWMACLAVTVYWIFLFRRTETSQRPGLKLTYLLAVESMAFLIFYQQQVTSLTLFALRAVDGRFQIGGVTLFHFSAGQFQALNPIWIMVVSPLLARIYHAAALRNRPISLAVKMLVGFILVTLGFFVWWQAASLTAGRVSAWIMVLGYGLISVAELLTMALGLAVIARYTSARSSGFMMGCLYLLWGVAMYFGSLVAMHAAMPDPHLPEIAAAHIYGLLFRDLFIAGLVTTLSVAALLPLAKKWDRQHLGATGTPLDDSVQEVAAIPL